MSPHGDYRRLWHIQHKYWIDKWRYFLDQTCRPEYSESILLPDQSYTFTKHRHHSQWKRAACWMHQHSSHFWPTFICQHWSLVNCWSKSHRSLHNDLTNKRCCWLHCSKQRSLGYINQRSAHICNLFFTTLHFVWSSELSESRGHHTQNQDHILKWLRTSQPNHYLASSLPNFIKLLAKFTSKRR